MEKKAMRRNRGTKRHETYKKSSDMQKSNYINNNTESGWVKHIKRQTLPD